MESAGALSEMLAREISEATKFSPRRQMRESAFYRVKSKMLRSICSQRLGKIHYESPSMRQKEQAVHLTLNEGSSRTDSKQLDEVLQENLSESLKRDKTLTQEEKDRILAQADQQVFQDDITASVYQELSQDDRFSGVMGKFMSQSQEAADLVGRGGLGTEKDLQEILEREVDRTNTLNDQSIGEQLGGTHEDGRAFLEGLAKTGISPDAMDLLLSLEVG